MIRIAVARVLEDVVKEQAYTRQTLYGTDHQILQALAATLRLRLIYLEKGMETWIFAITVLQLFLHLLVEVDVRWIRLDELISMLNDNVANQAVLTPIGMQLPQMLQHALMHLVYRQEVAKYRLDLRLIQQWIVRLCKLLQFVFEQLMGERAMLVYLQMVSSYGTYIKYGIQYAHIVGLCGIEVHEVIKPHGSLAWCGLSNLWLGMQNEFIILELIGTRGAVKEAIRNGQESCIGHRGSAFTRTQGSALQLNTL